MKKNISKFIFILSVLVLAMGISLSVPTFHQNASAEEVVESENLPESTEKSATEQSSDNSNGSYLDLGLPGFEVNPLAAPGGSGTESSPYTISNASQLAWFAKMTNDSPSGYYTKHVRLTANIDLSGKIWTPICRADNNYKYAGVFDGNGYTISGMTIDSTISCPSVGLFGYVSGAVIKNLKISNFYINNTPTANSLYIGTLAGYCNNSTLFYNCEDLTRSYLGLNSLGDGSGSHVVHGGKSYVIVSSYMLTSKNNGLNQYYIATVYADSGVTNWGFSYTRGPSNSSYNNSYTFPYRPGYRLDYFTTQFTSSTKLTGIGSCPSYVEKTGYSFQNWFRESAWTSGSSFTGSSTTTVSSSVTGPLILKATISPNTYTVTLDQNGGAGGTTSVSAIYDSRMPTITRPVRTGYNFEGYWDTAATSGGKQYWYASPDGATSNAMLGKISMDVAGNFTVYARWSAKTYSFVLDKTGGTGGGAVSGTFSFGTSPLPPNIAIPNRVGYKFKGYFTEASGGTQIYTAGGARTRTYWDIDSNPNETKRTTTTVTLFAQWEQATYKLTFVFNGSSDYPLINPAPTSGGTSNNVDKTTSYNASLGYSNFPTPYSPTRRGYNFLGWFRQDNNAQLTTGSVISDNNNNGDVSIIVEARWGAATNTFRVIPKLAGENGVQLNLSEIANITITGSVTASGDYDTSNPSLVYKTVSAVTGTAFTISITPKPGFSINGASYTPLISGYQTSGVLTKSGSTITINAGYQCGGDIVIEFTRNPLAVNVVLEENGVSTPSVHGSLSVEYYTSGDGKSRFDILNTSIQGSGVYKSLNLSVYPQSLLKINVTVNQGYHLESCTVQNSNGTYPIVLDPRFTGAYGGASGTVYTGATSTLGETNNNLGLQGGGTIKYKIVPNEQNFTSNISYADDRYNLTNISGAAGFANLSMAYYTATAGSEVIIGSATTASITANNITCSVATTKNTSFGPFYIAIKEGNGFKIDRFNVNSNNLIGGSAPVSVSEIADRNIPTRIKNAGYNKLYKIESYTNLDGRNFTITFTVSKRTYSIEAKASVQDHVNLSTYKNQSGIAYIGAGNSADTSVITKAYYFGETVTLSANNPDSVGFYFNGWYLNGTQFVPSSTEKNYNYTINKDTPETYIITAKYTRKRVDVKAAGAIIKDRSGKISGIVDGLASVTNPDSLGKGTGAIVTYSSDVLSNNFAVTAKNGFEFVGWAYVKDSEFTIFETDTTKLLWSKNETFKEFLTDLMRTMSTTHTVNSGTASYANGEINIYPVFQQRDLKLKFNAYEDGDPFGETDINSGYLKGSMEEMTFYFSLQGILDTSDETRIGTQTIPANQFQRVGYEFGGWRYINGKNVESIYCDPKDPDSPNKFLMGIDDLYANTSAGTMKSSLEFYAIWIAKTYNLYITGGTVGPDKQQVKTSDGSYSYVTHTIEYRGNNPFNFADASKIPFSYNGYTKLKWVFNNGSATGQDFYPSSGEGKLTTFTLGPEELGGFDESNLRTLTGAQPSVPAAKGLVFETIWEAETFDLELKANGGTFKNKLEGATISADGSSLTYKNGVTYGDYYLWTKDGKSNWTTPSRDGFRFAGFYILNTTDLTATRLITNNIDYYFYNDNSPVGNVTLTAIWEWLSSPAVIKNSDAYGNFVDNSTSFLYNGDKNDIMKIFPNGITFTGGNAMTEERNDITLKFKWQRYNFEAGRYVVDTTFVPQIYDRTFANPLQLEFNWDKGIYACEVTFTDPKYGIKNTTIDQNYTAVVMSEYITVGMEKVDITVEAQDGNFDKFYDGTNAFKNKVSVKPDSEILNFSRDCLNVLVQNEVNQSVYSYYSDKIQGYHNITFLIPFNTWDDPNGLMASHSYSENYNVRAEGDNYTPNDGREYKGTINRKAIELKITADVGFYTGGTHSVAYQVIQDRDFIAGTVVSGSLVTINAGDPSRDTVYAQASNGFDIASINISDKDGNPVTGNFSIVITGTYTIKNIDSVAVYTLSAWKNSEGILGNIQLYINSISGVANGSDFMLRKDENAFGNSDRFTYYHTTAAGTTLCFQVTGIGTPILKVYMNETVNNLNIKVGALSDGDAVFYKWISQNDYSKMIIGGVFRPDEVSSLAASRDSVTFNSITTSGPEKDQTYYALFTDKAVLTFDYNVTPAEMAAGGYDGFKAIITNGQSIPTDLIGLDGQVITKNIWNPAREGFKFAGWEIVNRNHAEDNIPFTAGALYNYGILSQTVRATWQLDDFTASIADQDYSGIYKGEITNVFTATPSVTNPGITFQYQWQKCTTNDPLTGSWVNYGGNRATINLKNVSDSGYYRCAVTAVANGVTTAPVYTNVKQASIFAREVRIDPKAEMTFDKVFDDNNSIINANFSIVNNETDDFKIEASLGFNGTYATKYVSMTDGNVLDQTITMILTGDAETIKNYTLVGTYAGKILKKAIEINVTREQTYSPGAVFEYTYNANSATFPSLLTGHVLSVKFTTASPNAAEYKVGQIDSALNVSDLSILDNSRVDVTANYDIDFTNVKLTIKKAVIGGVTFSGETVVYDGLPHKIELVGTVPAEVKVEYAYYTTSGNLMNNYPIQVGEYTVKVTLDVGNNYEAKTFSDVKLKIEARPLTITLTDDAKKTYDGSLEWTLNTTTGGFNTAFLNGTGDYLPVDAEGNFIEKIESIFFVTNSIYAGTYTFGGSEKSFTAVIKIVDLDGNDVTGNYTAPTWNGSFKIIQKDISIDIAVTKNYDKTAIGASETGISLVGDSSLITGDEIKGVSYEVNGVNVKTYTGNDVVSAQITIKNGDIDVTSSYKITVNSVSVTIDPKPIEFNGTLTKVYDGNTDLPTNGVFSGVVEGDRVGYTGNYESKDASTVVNIVSVILDNPNYTVTSEYITALNGVITPKEITISLKPEDGPYYQVPAKVNTPISVTASDFIAAGQIISGETFIGNIVTSGFTTGIYTQGGADKYLNLDDIDVSGEGALISNYTFTVLGGIEIIAAEIGDIDYSALQNIIYKGASLNDLVLITFAVNSVDYTVSLSASDVGVSLEVFKITDSGEVKVDTVIDSGKYRVQVLSDGSVLDLTGKEVSKEFTVKKKEVTVTGITKVYDGSNLVDPDSATINGIEARDLATVKVDAASTYDTAIVGENKILTLTLTGDGSNNYTIVGSPKGNITKKPYEVGTTAQVKFYDGNYHVAETSSQITGIGSDSFKLEITYQKTDVGIYDVAELFANNQLTVVCIENADIAKNYEFSYTGTLTIKKAQVTFAFSGADGNSLTYNGLDRQGDITITPSIYVNNGMLVSGKLEITKRLANIVDGSENFVSLAKNAANYKIYASVSTESTNYELVDASGNVVANLPYEFRIIPFAVTITVAEGTIKVPFDNQGGPTYIFDGYDTLVQGERVAVKFTKPTNANKQGRYNFTVVESMDSNYTVTIGNPENYGFIIIASDKTLRLELTGLTSNKLVTNYTADAPSFTDIKYDETSKRYYVIFNEGTDNTKLYITLSVDGVDITEIIKSMGASDLTGTVDLRNGTKNVGVYDIILRNGASTQFLSVELINSPTLEIVKQELTISSEISKVFDFTNEVNITVNGILTNKAGVRDDVTVKGQFNDINASDAEKPVVISILGSDASNYYITDISSKKGKISAMPVSIEMTETVIEYGYYNPNLTSFKSGTGDVPLAFNDGTLKFKILSDTNTDITEAAWPYLSGVWKLETVAKYNAGRTYSIQSGGVSSTNFKITSPTISIRINPKTLILSAADGGTLEKALEKPYDGTNVVNMDKLKVNGKLPDDDLIITGNYSDVMPGTLTVTFTLSGADGSNYTVEEASGTIKYVSKTLLFDYIGNISFVEDGESIQGNSLTNVQLSFPFTKDANSILGNIVSVSSGVNYPIPARKGYTFAGWFKSAALLDGEQVLNDADGVNYLAGIYAGSDVASLYAKWEIKTITINIEINTDNTTSLANVGGSVNGGVTVITQDYYSIATLNATTNEGYIFEGFFDINNNSLGTNNPQIRLRDNTTITARFTSIGITLQVYLYDPLYSPNPSIEGYNPEIFKANVNARFDATIDALGYTQQTNYAMKRFKFNEEVGALPTVLGKGVTFKGWFYRMGGELKEFTGGTLFELAGKPTTNSSFSVYANYDLNTYNITFNSDGGTIAGDTTKSVVFLDIVKELPIPTKKGYTFEGWYDSNNNKFDLGETGKRFTYDSDQTFLAKWVERTNNIDINLSGVGEFKVETNDVRVNYQMIGGKLQVRAPTNSTFTVVVTPGAGFDIQNSSWVYDNNKITLAGEPTRKVFSNFYEDVTLEINLIPRINTVYIQLNNTNATLDVSDASLVDERTDSYIKLRVPSGKQFDIIIKTNAGFQIGTYSISSSGQLGEITTGANGEIIRSFSGFFDDTNVSITIEPMDNVIRIESETKYATISVEGGVSLADNYGYTITAKTGATLRLTLTLAHGYNFDSIISNTLTGVTPTIDRTNPERPVIIITGFTESGTITFKYVPINYTLNAVAVNRENNGVLNFGTAQIVYGGLSNSTQIAPYKSSVQFVATAADSDGYKFVGWYLDAEGTNIATGGLQDSLTLTVDNETTLYAIFELRTYKVEYVAEKNGSIIGIQTQFVKHGFAATSVTAKADEGYLFDKWSDNSEAASRTDENIISDITLTAKFKRDSFIVQLTTFENRADTLIEKTEKSVGEVEYVEGSDTVAVGPIEHAGLKFKIGGYTEDEFTLKAIPKPGYFFVEWRILPEGNKIELKNDRLIDENGVTTRTTTFSNILGGTSYTIEAIFAPNINMINITYSTASTASVNAGQVNIDTTNKEVTVRSLNNYYNVTISALTGTTVKFDTSAYFGYIFRKSNTFTTDSTGAFNVVSAPTPDPDNNDISERATVEFSGFTGNVNITINVIADIFEVDFKLDGEVIAKSSVEFGQKVNIEGINGLTPSQRNHDFGGWWTYEIGQGTKYVDVVDENGTKVAKAVNNWAETEYQLRPDGETKYFTLYGFWILLKTKVTMDVNPSDLDIGFSSVITNINDAWYSNNEVRFEYGKEIRLSAPYIEGYKFNSYTITYDDQVSEIKNANVSLSGINSPNLNISLKYFVQIKVTATNLGGNITITQGNVEDGYFDPDQNILLTAEAKPGFNFMGWRHFGTEEIISQEARYELQVTKPTVFEAVFEGDKVNINATMVEHGRIASVTVNDTKVYTGIELMAGLAVNVGDVLTFVVEADYGFYHNGWETEGLVNNTYTVTSEDSFKTITFKPKFKAEEVDMTITKELGNGIQTEIENIGNVRVNGKEISTIALGYDDSISIEIRANDFYTFKQLLINGEDYTDKVVAGVYASTVAALFENISTELEFKIIFERLYWIDSGTVFDGIGTADNPIIIRTPAEMAYLAYAVNNNINDGYYAKAYYEIAADLDFNNKYWTPIGNETYKFEGFVDIKGHQYSNIVFAPGESFEPLYYGGLFSNCIPENIISTKPDYTTVYIVVGSVLGVALISVLAFVIVKIIKRRKYTELAVKKVNKK